MESLIVKGGWMMVPILLGSVVALAMALERIYFFSHRSAEGGHGLVLKKLGVDPILDLDLRLGEGTGAVLAMFIIEAGVKVYNEMATFEEAGVSKKREEI